MDTEATQSGDQTPMGNISSRDTTQPNTPSRYRNYYELDNRDATRQHLNTQHVLDAVSHYLLYIGKRTAEQPGEGEQVTERKGVEDCGLQKFHWFGKLPLELRFMIWNLSFQRLCRRLHTPSSRTSFVDGLRAITPLNQDRWDLNMAAVVQWARAHGTRISIFVAKHDTESGKRLRVEELRDVLRHGDDSQLEFGDVDAGKGPVEGTAKRCLSIATTASSN